MKQRLLFTLLALFVSIGLVNATITVTVSKGSTGSLSWTKSTNQGAVPVSLTIGGTAESVSGTSINVANYVKDKSATFVLEGSVSRFAVNDVKVEGNFVVDGHTTLTSLIIKGAKGSKLTSVTLDDTDKAQLSTLQINDCGLESLPNYLSVNLAEKATVDLQNNELSSVKDLVVTRELTYKFGGNKIKDWPSLDNANAKLNIEYGSQSEALIERTAGAANAWFDIWNGDNSGSNTGLKGAYGMIDGDVSKVSFSWKDANDRSVTVKAHDTNKGEFQFYNTSNGYFDGVYKCTIAPTSGVKAPTYVVTVTVKPAEFTLTYNVDPDDGNVFKVGHVKKPSGASSTEITSGSKVKKGDQLVFTVVPDEDKGYAFSKFVYTDKNGDDAEKAWSIDGEGIHTVVGIVDDPDLNVKALFTKNTYKIMLDTSTENGTYEILNAEDNKEVVNGQSLAYGTKLSIKATPKQGYLPRVSVKTSEGTTELTRSATANEKGAYTFTFTNGNYTIEEATTIKVWFEQSSYELKVKKLDDYSLRVNANGSSYIYGGNNTNQGTLGYYTDADAKVPTIAAGTIVTLEMIKEEDSDAKDITKVLLGGKEIGTTAKVQFTMPANEAIITFELSKLAELIASNFSAEVDNNVQEYTYDGKPHAFEYTVTPAGLTGFVVTYSRYGEYTEKYTETVPTAVGEYKVRIAREADGSYAEFNSRPDGANPIIGWRLKIVPATPTITTRPNVTVNKDGDFVITSGVAKVGGENVTGEWTVIDSNNKAITKSNLTESGIVTVAFLPTENKDNLNGTKANDGTVSDAATVQVPVTIDNKALSSKKIILSDIPEDMELTVWNGDLQVTGNPITVPAGTGVKFKLTYPAGYSTVKIVYDDAEGKVIAEVNNGEGGNKKPEEINDDVTVTVTYSGKATTMKPVVECANEHKVSYDYSGDVDLANLFTSDKFSFKSGTINTADETELKSKMVITYKDKDGKAVVAPVNAGEYTVVVTIPKVETANATYEEVSQEFEKYYVIEQVEYEVSDITWPKDAVVGVGKNASTAQFIGGAAPVEGTFHFVEEDKIGVPETGKEYDVKFVPADATNYATVLSTNKARVVVTDQRTLFISDVTNGTVVVTDQNGNVLKDEQILDSKITSIKVSATPASGYVVSSIKVNNSTISNGGSYTLGSDNVVVNVTFARQYTITLSTAPRGVKIASKPTSNVVTAGGTYTFTLNHLSGDKPTVTGASNISVSTSGGTSTVKITNIQANATLAIAISATPIKVTLEKTLSKAGKEMGTLRASGLNSSNECYYGDKVTITATANAGVEFSGWEGLTSTANPYEFEATQASYTFKAEYDGILTGIESVDEVRYYGADGYIYVNAPAPGTLTIISMNGRSQRLQVSGQTRVTVAAGIYGIVLDMDGEVIRDKVVVR